MSSPSLYLLDAFPEAALLVLQGLIVASNAMAKHYLPELQANRPLPHYITLPQQATGSGSFTTGASTYMFRCSQAPQEQQLIVFSPAPQSALTDTQLDGALRQMRQFMGEFLVELGDLPQSSRPGFHKSYYRMFRLLDNLEYMRLTQEPASQPHPLATLDLAGLCRQTIQAADSLVQERGVSLHYECVHTSILIPGDSSSLQRMLLELISNFVRVTDRGSVYIRLRIQGGRALLSFSGSGAPPSQRQLSAMLQQDSDWQLPPPGSGAGLGLSVVRHIVSLHQASMLVEWGEGAPTVIVSLPTGPLDARATVNTPTAQKDGGLSPLLMALSDVLPASLFALVTLD